MLLRCNAPSSLTHFQCVVAGCEAKVKLQFSVPSAGIVEVERPLVSMFKCCWGSDWIEPCQPGCSGCKFRGLLDCAATSSEKLDSSIGCAARMVENECKCAGGTGAASGLFKKIFSRISSISEAFDPIASANAPLHFSQKMVFEILSKTNRKQSSIFMVG